MTNTIETINTVSQLAGTAEYAGIAKDVIIAISAAVAAVMAVWGLTAWRRELKGKSEYAKAKEVLKAVYRVREGFKHVRRPAIWQFEYPEEMIDSNGYLKPEHDHEGNTYVYETRIKVLNEAFSELEEQTLDAQVEWGPEFEDVIKPLRECRADLMIAIQDFLEAKKIPHYNQGRTKEERTKHLSVLYYGGPGSERDKFTPQINKAIEGFEDRLRPRIKS